MVWVEMPKRAAWLRLMVILSCGALARRSLEASASCGSARIRASIFTDHAFSSAMFASCSVYWKLPLPDAASHGDVLGRLQEERVARNSTAASCGRSRSMICDAERLRSSRGFNTMKNRAVFAVWAPPAPVFDPKPATSGSRMTTSPCARIRRIISSGETLWAASEKP